MVSSTSSIPAQPAGLVFHGLVAHSDVGVAAQMRHAIQQRGTGTVRAPAPHRRIGIISNHHSHRNRHAAQGRFPDHAVPGTLYRAPRTLPELSLALLDFAEAGIDLLVVDGGDGTVRDVLTCVGGIFDTMPHVAVVPSGKTNALALDLGVPSDWTIADAVSAGQEGVVVQRAPIEILRRGSIAPDLRGFLFGAGAFVMATGLAQRTHKAGAFNGLAVGLSLGWGVLQTLFGPPDNMWRAGERMRLRVDEEREQDQAFYILLGSTLERLPLNLKPFGPVREGLKLLAVDAPPRHLARGVPLILKGSTTPWLDRSGYHRGDCHSFDLSLDGGFILDGELYAGGQMTVRRGTPIQFVVP